MDGRAPLGRHDPELVSAPDEVAEEVLDPVERLERGVQRLVVGAVDVDQLVDAIRVEIAHLRHEPLPTDGGTHSVLVGLTAEHGDRRVTHRGHDDRPRVDQGAVEVEEDDAVAHRPIVSTSVGRPAT